MVLFYTLKLVNIMRYYLVDTFIGPLILDEHKNIITHKIISSDVLCNELFRLQKGEISDRYLSILEEVSLSSEDMLIVEDSKISTTLKVKKPKLKVILEFPNEIALYIRENLVKILTDELNIFKNPVELYQTLHKASLCVTRERVKEAAERRDKLIVQVIDALDDVTKIINLMVSRLREWYSIHFPELDNLVDNHKLFTKMVLEIGERKNFEDKISTYTISDELKSKIIRASQRSIGAKISDIDLRVIQQFANETLELILLKADLEQYLTDLMNEIAPNITGLVGPLIGARLIRLAGGLIELSRLPSSTIQVLGAEKALFLALKKKGRTPKHGVIFQHILVHSSPKWLRGKIARALAGKITIAARVDAFSGALVADKLKNDLNERVKEIKKKYPKPPIKEKRLKKKKLKKKKKEKRKKRGNKKRNE